MSSLIERIKTAVSGEPVSAKEQAEALVASLRQRIALVDTAHTEKRTALYRHDQRLQEAEAAVFHAPSDQAAREKLQQMKTAREALKSAADAAGAELQLTREALARILDKALLLWNGAGSNISNWHAVSRTLAAELAGLEKKLAQHVKEWGARETALKKASDERLTKLGRLTEANTQKAEALGVLQRDVKALRRAKDERYASAVAEGKEATADDSDDRQLRGLLEQMDRVQSQFDALAGQISVLSEEHETSQSAATEELDGLAKQLAQLTRQIAELRWDLNAGEMIINAARLAHLAPRGVFELPVFDPRRVPGTGFMGGAHRNQIGGEDLQKIQKLLTPECTFEGLAEQLQAAGFGDLIP